MANNTAILILNHFQDRHLMRLCWEILADYGSSSDVFLLTDRTNAWSPIKRQPSGCREFTFTVDDLTALGYPRSSNVRDPRGQRRNFKLGHGELPVLLFFLNHRDYQYYWLVEYDVRFTGSWRTLSSAFETSGADLLGTSLVRKDVAPEWDQWSTLRWPKGERVPPRPIRGFFPIFRVSNHALVTLDREYRRAHFGGHMEGLMPTLLHQRGLKIEDIGGSGEFVNPENINRFYRNNPVTNGLGPGTFVYRPVMDSMGNEPDKLWHSVKQERRSFRRRITRVYRRGWGVATRLVRTTLP